MMLHQAKRCGIQATLNGSCLRQRVVSTAIVAGELFRAKKTYQLAKRLINSYRKVQFKEEAR